MNAASWAAVILLQATLFFLYRYLNARNANPNTAVLPSLVNEFSGVITGWTAFALVMLPVMRRVRWEWRRPATSLAVYGATLIAFSAAHTTMIWGVRTAAYPLIVGRGYNYGTMPLPYLMELPLDAVAFILAALVYHLLREQYETRERMVRAADVERALSEAQLRSLQANLQPHFLFNALNTIASRVHDDPQQADRMITHLAELLRATIRDAHVHRVELRRELELLDHYAALLDARFGDRCSVVRRVPADLMDVHVPALVLQPLVENAVRHGNVSRIGKGVIDVSAVRVGDEIELVVSDDGPGATADPWAGDGLGLKGTAERLRLLYGDRQTMRAGNENGGFTVTIRVPLEQKNGA